MDLASITRLMLWLSYMLTARAQEPKKVIYYSTKEIAFYPGQGKTFDEARDECRARRSDLAQITTKGMSSAVNAGMSPHYRLNDTGYWIGGHVSEEGIWKWINGENFQFKSFNSRRRKWPLWTDIGACVNVGRRGRKTWTRMPCDARAGYICQKDAVRNLLGTCEYAVRSGPKKAYDSALRECKTINGSLAIIRLINGKSIDLIAQSLYFNGTDAGHVLWVGGRWKDGNWLWNDGTKHIIDTLKESKKDAQNQCLALKVAARNGSTVTEWRPSACSERHNYVCEVPVKNPCERIKCAVNSKCVAVGCRWKCQCVGVYFGPSCKQEYKPPIITSVQTSNCTKHYTVTWQASAINVLHRIFVVPVNNSKARSLYRTVFPTISQRKLIGKTLSANTEYTITIKACPDACHPALAVSSKFFIGRGVSPPSQNLFTQYSKDGGDFCSVQIIRSPDGKEPIDYFKVVITSFVLHLPPSRARITVNRVTSVYNISASPDDINTSFWFATKPNRRYSIFVRAVNCAGSGLSYSAQGNCNTKSSVPDQITAPGLSRGGTEGDYRVRIYPVNETNGPASCYFILLTGIAGDDAPEEMPLFSEFDTLEVANATESTNASTIYIAAALPAIEVTRPYAEFELGDGSKTECDALGIMRRFPTTNGSIDKFSVTGRNFPIPVNITFRVAVVVATPITPKQVMYKASTDVIFQTFATRTNQGDSSPKTLTIILIVVFAFLLLIVLLLAIFFWKRRKRNPCSGQRSSVEREQPFPLSSNLPSASQRQSSNRATEGESASSSEKHLYQQISEATERQYENTENRYEVPMTASQRRRVNGQQEVTRPDLYAEVEPEQEPTVEYFAIEAPYQYDE